MEIKLKELLGTQFKTKNFIITTDNDGIIEIKRNTVMNNEAFREIIRHENYLDSKAMADNLTTPLINLMTVYTCTDDVDKLDEEFYYRMHQMMYYYSMEKDSPTLIQIFSRIIDRCEDTKNNKFKNKFLTIIKEKYKEWCNGKEMKNNIKNFLKDEDNDR